MCGWLTVLLGYADRRQGGPFGNGERELVTFRICPCEAAGRVAGLLPAMMRNFLLLT